MDIRQIQSNETVSFGELTIGSVRRLNGSIEFALKNNIEFPYDNYYEIKRNGKIETERYFINDMVILIKELKLVVCEDWFQDENLTKSNINQPSLRWNESEEIGEYNFERTIGAGLADNYEKHIDLEFARLTTIECKIVNDEEIFEILLKGSYSEKSRNGDLNDFHTGPFKFWSKSVEIKK